MNRISLSNSNFEISSCVDAIQKNISDAESNIIRLNEMLNGYKIVDKDAETVIDYDAETVVDDEETVVDDDEETILEDNPDTGDDSETVIVRNEAQQPMESYVVAYLKLHSCSQCPFKTKHKESHKNHMLRHGEARPFKCDHTECDKSFKTKGDLKQHQYKHAGKKLECDFVGCDKKFTYPSELYTHKKKHHTNQ